MRGSSATRWAGGAGLMEHIDTDDAYADVFGMHPTPGMVSYDLLGGYSGEPLTLVVGNEGVGDGFEDLPGFFDHWTQPARERRPGWEFLPCDEQDVEEWAPVSDFYAYRVGS